MKPANANLLELSAKALVMLALEELEKVTHAHSDSAPTQVSTSHRFVLAVNAASEAEIFLQIAFSKLS